MDSNITETSRKIPYLRTLWKTMQGKVFLELNNRWHNHLYSEVKKEPLSYQEGKIVFEAQRRIGNKWADIAKLIPGRTDNIVKNFFYSTLRRELRKLLRKIYGNQEAEPKEVSVVYMQKLVKEHNLGYEEIENENVRELLYSLAKEDTILEPSYDHHSL